MFSIIFLIALSSAVCERVLAENADDIIDLSYLGNRIYGTPSHESGLRLSELENSAGNPEEQGSYLEGDILFPVNTVQKNGMKGESYRWPKGEVPFQIRGHFNAREMDLIEQAIKTYHQKTCIKFFPRRATDADYISIESGNTGCWSSIGRTGGPQVVNLQPPGCVNKIGTVIHELMHALGFLHEQNSEDRDGYIIVNTQNIKPGYENNFDKAPKDTTNRFGVPYDYGSVMHYSPTSFSKNNQPTLTAKSGAKANMGQREGFSQHDIDKINRMYKCKSTSASSGYNSPPASMSPIEAFSELFGGFLGPRNEEDMEEMVKE